MSLTPLPLPTKEHLLEMFDYDPLVGDLVWKHRPIEHFSNPNTASQWNGRFAGKVAGSIKKTKYGKHRIEVVVDWIRYFAHRLIWKIMTGEDPLGEIDHEDLNQLNNKWNNLREASSEQNKFNTAVKSNSTTGLKGVKPRGNRFMAMIRINGKKTYLGTFDTPEEAHETYMAVAKDLHGNFFKDD